MQAAAQRNEGQLPLRPGHGADAPVTADDARRIAEFEKAAKGHVGVYGKRAQVCLALLLLLNHTQVSCSELNLLQEARWFVVWSC